MDATQSQESATRALIAAAKQLDPDSPEFYDACQALIKQSAGRRSKGLGALGSRLVEPSAAPDAQSGTPRSHQGPTQTFRDESEGEALRESRRREGQVRAEVETLQTELRAVRAQMQTLQSQLQTARTEPEPRHSELQTVRAQVQTLQSELQTVQAELETRQAELANVKTRYSETLAALEAASERASQARIEFANAMSAIAERDAAINQMRQSMADQDREINELQQLLIQAEEARISDASAILDSLDKYRA